METNSTSSMAQRLNYLITKLNSKRSPHAFRALVEIRTKYFNSKSTYLNNFIKENGLKMLVIYLQDENKKIVDVALSILGHCVLEQEPRILFRKAGGLPVLAKVLRSAEDSNIQSRACRTVGSLAHDKRNAMKLIELNVQDSLSHIVMHTENEEVLCMVLRAVKHLSDSKEHVAALGRCYLIPNLWVLLTRTENQNVLKNLLNTLCHVCNYMQRFSENSAHYWVGTEGGGKYIARLVGLSQNEVHSLSSKAFQLFQQVVHDKHVRPFLTAKEAFEALIPLVQEKKDSYDKNWIMYMTSLFLLCRENPSMFRQSGGIPVLLDLIRRSSPDNSDTCPDSFLRAHHSNIFSTLLAFKNDTESLAQLTEEGVIDVLVSKIVSFIDLSKNQEGKSCRAKGIKLSEKRNGERTNGDEEDAEIKEELESILDVSAMDVIDHETATYKARRSDVRARLRSKRQYRTTSPSYQAVELEYDQLFRFRESSSTDVLNMFGWNSNPARTTDVPYSPSSPQSCSSSVSPIHSSWSDYGSDSDVWDSPLSPGVCSSPSSVALSPSQSEQSSPVGSPSATLSNPLLPSTSRSSSEFGESDGEETNTVCYSPVNFDLSQIENPSSSPAPPPSKRAKICTDLENLCCESDLKMSWLHLGQVEGKDFYENWPEFSGENKWSQPVEWAIYLLYRLSWLADTPRQLTEQRLIKTIIDYLTETPRPTFYACRILFRLSSHPDLFVSLLLAYFPLEIYLRLVRNANMKHCCPLHSSLRRVGEQILEQTCSIVTQFGRGEMENVLLRNKEDTSTQAVALATPVIVKSRCLLRHFLIDLDVLEMIWNLLKDEENVAYAAASLSSLGSFLKMDDLLCPSTDLSDLFNGESCRIVGLQYDVFFQISPKENVGAVKHLLQAPFFEAMFHRGFTESSSTIIPLPNIEAPILEVILHVVYGCGRQCKVISGIDRLIKSDQSAVSLLQSMDRFLLLQYSEPMCNIVGSQDWSIHVDFPANYISLFNSLSHWDFPFGAKLRNHLLFFPFSNLADCPSRVEIIKTFLQTSSTIADNVLEDWKSIFLSRMDDS